MLILKQRPELINELGGSIMQIGKVIRKYRKERNMTQEEMANRLGVTAPAVNKWENGNSMPDIMLLAPIARVLHISLDTLLSFRENLSTEEIRSLLQEMDDRFKKESYENVFAWAKQTIRQYPNCEQLILFMAISLDARRLFENVPEAEKYDDDIQNYYIRALHSQDEAVRIQAADALFGFFCRKEEYEQAEKYLSYYSIQNPERKRKQAEIYNKLGRIDDAYRTYEELLCAEYQITSMVLHALYLMAMKEKDFEKARMLIDKEAKLVSVFDRGTFYEYSCKLEFATAQKDVAQTIKLMAKMLESVDTIDNNTKSPLYSHMEFQEIKEEFMTKFKKNLLKCFQDEETYGFLAQDSRWHELVKKGN